MAPTTITPIDATDRLEPDDLRPIALEEDADNPDECGALLRHEPGEWATTMNPAIVAVMRDLLTDAPMRVTIDYLDAECGDMDSDWMRLTGELVALTADGNAVFVGGQQGTEPTQRKEVPVEDIYTLAF